MVAAKENGLGKAIKDGEEYIKVEGDLSKKVIRIMATGKTAWVVAVGFFAIAVAGGH